MTEIQQKVIEMLVSTGFILVLGIVIGRWSVSKFKESSNIPKGKRVKFLGSVPYKWWHYDCCATVVYVDARDYPVGLPFNLVLYSYEEKNLRVGCIFTPNPK